jgi:hypothetical protein
MPSYSYMRTLCIAAAALLLTVPLLAQNGSGNGSEAAPPASSYESPANGSSDASAGAALPEDSPEAEAAPAEASTANEEGYETGYPYNLQLLATRHFDFIVAPKATPRRGSMEDNSISLGEYARQLRAEKEKSARPQPAPMPGAMAQPAEPR